VAVGDGDGDASAGDDGASVGAGVEGPDVAGEGVLDANGEGVGSASQAVASSAVISKAPRTRLTG
jgi:hypothetical protein